MKIVVFGASGNHGTSLLQHLSLSGSFSVVGVSRRRPSLSLPGVRWAQADITEDDLLPLVSGADAVVSLAWLIQPGRREHVTRRVNVDGSARVFEAVARAGVPRLVYASSVGAYSPGPKDRAVDESWPTHGVASSFYSRHKAAVERILDSFEAAHADVRVVRMRPGLTFKGDAATQIRRLFAGPFLPSFVARRPPVFPLVAALPGRAHRRPRCGVCVGALGRLDEGCVQRGSGPVIDAHALGARPVPVPPPLLRAGASASFALRLQPSEPGWVDMAFASPLMSTERRARVRVGARRSSVAAFDELLDGLRGSSGLDTPPLDPDTSGPLRVREVFTGVGSASR